MSTKEQKGGQALSHQMRLFGSLKQLQPKTQYKPLTANKKDRQNSLDQTEMYRNLGPQPIKTKLIYDRKLHTQNHIT